MNPYDYFLYPYLMPRIPSMNTQPITLYALLELLVNEGKEEKTSVRNLAKVGRTKIFDFEYPLSNYVNKAEFETNILNHFIKRRIGYETPVDFLIHLETKMNEIMPFYNKMFDALETYKINESEKTIHDFSSNKTIDNTSTSNSENVKNGKINRTGTDETTGENTISNTSSTDTTVTEDRRNSQLPQSEIENVQNASYLTDYTLNNNTSNSEDTSESTGNSTQTVDKTEEIKDNTTITNEENGTNNTIEANTSQDVITKIDPKLIFEYLEKMKNIYSMIYKDLDVLFYQLIY
jgi:hypothetical protein